MVEHEGIRVVAAHATHWIADIDSAETAINRNSREPWQWRRPCACGGRYAERIAEQMAQHSRSL
jgi:hypothetical protein